MEIAPSLARSFERDGAACVRGAVSPAHVALAREAIDANLADLSPRARRASADDDAAFVEDFCNWQRLPAMRRFIEESGVAAIAGGVPGPRRRRVLSVRFLGDDVTHAPRRWTTSPPFPGLEDDLPKGAPMDHPLFPLLWTAA